MRKLARTIVSALVVASVAGCGGGPQDPGPIRSGDLPIPALQALSPTNVSAGEELMIIGQGFCDPQLCRTRLTFEGTFQGTSGAVPVSLEVEPEYVNQGTLRWTFGPNVPFSPHPEMGTFSGTLTAVNVGLDGLVGGTSAPLDAPIQVGPSIIVRQMGPQAGACGVGLTDTVENTSFMFEMEVVGVNPGTAASPLLFSYTFIKENFQFEGRYGDEFHTDPQQIFPVTGPVTLVDRVQTGTVSTLGAGQLRKVAAIRQAVVNAGSGSNSGSALFDFLISHVPLIDYQTRFELSSLKTAPIPEPEVDSYRATIMVAAVDSVGNMAKRSIPLRVWTPIELSASGDANPVKAFEPVPVSGCIPGTTPPATLAYAENTQEKRLRRLETSTIAKPTVGLDVLIATKVEAELGMKLHEEASSEQLKGVALAAQVLPGEFGVIYRQTIQLERLVTVVEHSACGQTQELGTAVVTDWLWSPELAKAATATCPPFPPSKLRATP